MLVFTKTCLYAGMLLRIELLDPSQELTCHHLVVADARRDKDVFLAENILFVKISVEFS